MQLSNRLWTPCILDRGTKSFADYVYSIRNVHLICVRIGDSTCSATTKTTLSEGGDE